MTRVLELFGEPFSDGGQEAFVMNIVRAIDLTDLCIDVFTPYGCTNEYYKKIIEDNHGKVTHCDLPFTPGKSRTNIRPVIHNYFKNNQYDVVHIHTGSVSVLALAAEEAKKAGIKKVIVHAHTGQLHKNLKHELVKVFYEPKITGNADVFCACSAQAAAWQYSEKTARNDVVIVKNGIDVEQFRFDPSIRETMRKSLNISPDEYVIGNVGRFTDEKNQAFLVELFRVIAETDNQVRLLLVGTGDNFPAIEQTIQQYHLEERVILTGSVHNVSDYLQVMDVFVVPSKYEGLSLVSIEAQAAGLPLVASDTLPKDVKLSEDVTFLSLEEDRNVWCSSILRYKNHDRKNNLDSIYANGFSVQDTAKIMRDIYLEQ